MAFFGYKLLEVPRGLTLDEAAFGYNAALLAKTGRDENHRFLPLFVLSSNGTDWRQPMTQYYLTGIFKIFGASVFWLRFSSTLLVVGSILALFFVARSELGLTGAVAAAAVMTMTPILMIQSHEALDNIMPIPLTIIWLWSVGNYLRNGKTKWMLIIGIVLGASLYSYKGMRPIAPIWLLLSFLLPMLKFKKEMIKKWSLLATGAAPFFLIIPWIEKHYPGAMMGGAQAVFHNLYEFLAPFLSSFDISYWYVTGDLVGIHTTGMHGMYLLASAPWFFAGIYLAIKKRNVFMLFALAAFFLGPLLFGSVGSVHRFSRLLMMVPIYSLIAGWSLSEFWKTNKKSWVVFGALLALVNFGDFVRYYWVFYPGVTEAFTGDFAYRRDFEELRRISVQTDSEAIISEEAVRSTGESGKFFQVINFGKLLRVVKVGVPPKKGEVLLTPEEAIPGAKLTARPVIFRIFVNDSNM